MILDQSLKKELVIDDKKNLRTISKINADLNNFQSEILDYIRSMNFTHPTHPQNAQIQNEGHLFDYKQTMGSIYMDRKLQPAAKTTMAGS